MATKEKVFPRGGRNPALSKPIKAPNFSLFDKATSKTVKKTKKKKKKDIDVSPRSSRQEKGAKSVSENGLAVKFVDDLAPSVLREGSLVLGIVSQIGEKFVNMSLPGGSWGIVSLLNVSQFYKSLIVSSKNDIYVGGLMELFRIGDILPARVLSGSAEERNKFTLSLDPALINSRVTDVQTGMVLAGSVKSEEDHGYIIDFGIPNVNGFLNFDKIENRQSLLIGKLVRCAVVESTSLQGVSNVQVSLLPQDVQKCALAPDSMYPIHSFVPGLQFNVTVTRVLKNGVEVSYTDNQSLKGYIYEDYLPALFPNLEKIKVGGKYVGVLLYVKPLVNVPYFRVMSQRPDSWIYKYGQIVKGKVVKSTRAGITFRLGKKLLPMKCFVPYVKLKDANKIIDDEVSTESLYPVGKVVNSIRLRKIDYMKRCYIGATDKRSVEEKIFSLTDIKCGDIVPCKIESIDSTALHLKFGNLTGWVDLTDATDIPMTNPGGKFKIGQSVQARVMDIVEKTRLVRLTMKPTLLKKKVKLLTSYSDAKPNDSYTGTIRSVLHSKLIIKFFNNVTGEVPKRLTPYGSEPSLSQHYARGQLVKCYVVSSNGLSNLLLSLLPTQQLNMDLTIGDEYKVVVKEVRSRDLMVEARRNKHDEPITGIIPCHLIDDYPGLGHSLLPTYTVSQTFQAHLVLNQPGTLPVFSVCESIRSFYNILSKEHIGDADSVIAAGQVYPFIYKYVNRKTNKLTLSSLVPGSRKRVIAAVNDESNVLPLKKYQLVYGYALRVTSRTIEVSLELSKVWDKNYHTSLALLDMYVDGMKRLVDHQRRKKDAYLGDDIQLGSIVTCSVNEEKKGPVYEVENAVAGSVKNQTNGRTVTGKLVWINGVKRRLYVHEKLKDLADDKDEDVENQMHRAQIVYIGSEVVVAELKGQSSGRLVFVPRKRHVNDFKNTESPYSLGDKTKLWVERGRLGNLLAIDRQVTLLKERRLWKSYEASLKESIRAMKRKRVNATDGASGKIPRLSDGDVEVVDERFAARTRFTGEEEDGDDLRCEYVSVNGGLRQDDIKQEKDDFEDDSTTINGLVLSDGVDASSMAVEIKSEVESEDETNRGKDPDVYTKERIFLSSSSEDESSDSEVEVQGKANGLNVGFNWDVLRNRDLLSGANLKPNESSSEDEDEDGSEETGKKKKKKTKMSKAEREEKAKAEEERLRLIEERLMRADTEPETADDFDRALLAAPNSSALWVKYMAFHLQATEIEKARAVARRALKTIAFNEEREKLNVWVALLNLENLYGNEESLNKTLSEALMCNEPYHIQLHMLNMNGQSGKFDEMEKVGSMMMRKFKDVQSMWNDVGHAYYKVGRLESARNVLQRALPLLERKRHVELISQFAQMENKYGSAERAQTLYETILSSFPKRVDVWSCYVDMLVKSNSIDLARQVLERATSQTIPPKKMKTLFKKFLAFEEVHGTPEMVERVREAAADYVESIAAMS